MFKFFKRTGKHSKKAARTESKKASTKRRKKSARRKIKIEQKRKVGAKTRRRKPVLAKADGNPVLSPKENNYWEAWQTFNPTAILLEERIHFLYRAIGRDGISRFGYASSEDGRRITERLDYPVYEHEISSPFSPFSFASGGSFGGCEDPRIVRVEQENKLYMLYTACDGTLRLALTSINRQDFLNKKWDWAKPVLISPPHQLHKNWVIFPRKIKGQYAILTSISPKVLVAYRDNLEFKPGEYIRSYYNSDFQEGRWDNWRRGVGPSPLETKDGFLIFYHGVGKQDPYKYKVGAMILDRDDPTKVLYCSKEPVLEQGEQYENNGFKPGVIYASGAVIKGNTLFVYYGIADSYAGVAWADINEFLENVKSGIKPKVHRRLVERKKK